MASKVQQHRARRRKRVDPDGTMSLDFPTDQIVPPTAPPAPQVPELQAVALRPEAPRVIPFPRTLRPAPAVSRHAPPAAIQSAEGLELAAPVLDSPRILYAPEPEQLDLLSSFADIRLEADDRRPGPSLELGPKAAPLQPRMLSGLMDFAIVLCATLLFAALFLGMAGWPQPSRLALACGVATGGCLWLVFQCVFLMYGRATPGMQMADLELCTFSGDQVSVPMRGCRALASTLSAFSLGLGFAWALVDEDTLGWHDRMTQTHLRKAVGRLVSQRP
ncbi:MAG TPA: RDD family protein [Verrucomicrobiae bacterium]|nr:RDD family protein [Verrucomicrobiae bacterium]